MKVIGNIYGNEMDKWLIKPIVFFYSSLSTINKVDEMFRVDNWGYL